MSTVHVLPVRDLIDHEPDNCVCIPSVEYLINRDGDASRLVTHDALTPEPAGWVAIR